MGCNPGNPQPLTTRPEAFDAMSLAHAKGRQKNAAHSSLFLLFKTEAMAFVN
jgi:hypothetical protein